MISSPQEIVKGNAETMRRNAKNAELFNAKESDGKKSLNTYGMRGY
nr:hypothetical protein [[Eubacterium] cellulosolvens]